MNKPWYVNIGKMEAKDGKLYLPISIKKLGMPFLLARAMQKFEISPWYIRLYAWLWLYPKYCVRVMWGGAFGN